MDNFYNSVSLTKYLLDQQTYICTYITGTLRANRKNNCQEVITKEIKKGEIIRQYTADGICLMKWKDKRDLLTIPSEFDGVIANERGKEMFKPRMVMQYNKHMGSIDYHNQIISYFPSVRKIIRWYKKMAFTYFKL